MNGFGRRSVEGFGLLDLLITLVIASLLMALGVPAYDGFVARAKNARAIGDIGTLSVEIERFRLKNNDRIPLSLNELNYIVPDDPWDAPYEYFNIVQAGPGNGAFRKRGRSGRGRRCRVR